MEQLITIDSNEFVERMQEHWETTLGNVSSDALRLVWKQLSSTFNGYIGGHADKEWYVLQPPTGSGKTQGTIVYASMLSELEMTDHPGMLIVTRRIFDADLIADQINELSGREVAVSFHSDKHKELSIHELSKWPVLVITHRAYELALDQIYKDQSNKDTWDYFNEWIPKFDSNGRKLIVIDESLDIVEHNQVTASELNHTIGCLDTKLLIKYPSEIEAIKVARDHLLKIEAMNFASTTTTIVKSVLDDITKAPNFSELIKDLKQVRFDFQVHKNDTNENNKMRSLHEKRLNALQRIYNSWMYYARLENKETLNTARLLVPSNVRGAVVLDATAKSNLIYTVFDKAKVLTPPEGSRNYQNVNAHFLKGFNGGKVSMQKNAKKLAKQLMADLNTRLAGRNVLIITHKSVRPSLELYEGNTSFKMNIAHWFNAAGSNEWKDCDAVVLWGLPFLPDYVATNTFMACQGVQEDEWLTDVTKREFKGIKDIKQALKVGASVVEIVQGLNRIASRKVIDTEGNCPEVDFYIPLPNNTIGEAIYKGIVEEMPRMTLGEPWKLDTDAKPVKKGNGEIALVSYLTNMMRGKVSASQVKSEIGISPATFKRLVAKLKDTTSSLYQSLIDIGVKYQVSGKGQRQVAHFVKS